MRIPSILLREVTSFPFLKKPISKSTKSDKRAILFALFTRNSVGSALPMRELIATLLVEPGSSGKFIQGVKKVIRVGVNKKSKKRVNHKKL